jgi:hypothetical protein
MAKSKIGKVEGPLPQKYVPVGISTTHILIFRQNFGTGFYEGITDIITKPVVGAKKEGTLGFVKGLGKGSMNMVAKPGSGK